MRLAEWWPYACRRWPVDTAVRSEKLTVCRVRYGPELYGKIIRIDDDPPTLFVGARPPERARRVAGATSDGRFDIVRAHECSAGRTVYVARSLTPDQDPARLLVCKAAVKASAWSHSVALIPICPGHESQMCPHVHRFTARCCASWHTLGTPGVAYPRASKTTCRVHDRSTRPIAGFRCGPGDGPSGSNTELRLPDSCCT